MSGSTVLGNPPPDIVLRVDNLTVHFQRTFGWRRRTVYAVDDVNLQIGEAETLALVGESGSGKSTVGRAIVGLVRPTSGRIFYGSRDVTDLSRREWRSVRPHAQILFQESSSTLNPRRRVGDSVIEPLVVHRLLSRSERSAAVSELLRSVGLPAAVGDRYPEMLSGGQRQRVSMARALALKPRLLVADEPLTGLDVSIQAQIVALMRRLQVERRTAYLFISHDLAAVRQIADHVAIMYLGRIVELGPKTAVYQRPLHPYAQALLGSAPRPFDRSKQQHRRFPTGEPPSSIAPPPGCRFNTRCPLAHDPCFSLVPPMRLYGDDHWAACWALDGMPQRGTGQKPPDAQGEHHGLPDGSQPRHQNQPYHDIEDGKHGSH